MRRNVFGSFALGVLGWNLLVIVWGAFVRATKSGAGCGDHWPMCNGEVAPRPRSVEMAIEFTHRATSGLSLILVAALVVWAFRRFPKGHAARLGAGLSGVFILTEALLGAGLVLFRLVAGNTSTARAWYLAAHLINTFVLVGSLALTAWWGHGAPRVSWPPPASARRSDARWSLVGLAGTLLLAVSGGVAALGDTLFPSRTLAEGLARDFDPSAHLFIRLRVWHPVIALAVGGYLAWLAFHLREARPSAAVRGAGLALVVCVAAQVSLGGLNFLLQAPVWLQLLHLLLADLLWVALVILTAATLSAEEPPTAPG